MQVALPYGVVDQPGFAGPRTRWRGAHVETGATFEVIARSEVPDHRVPADALRVFTEDAARSELLFTPSTAGATLGEIVDASAQQGARLDPGFASAILEPALAQMLTPTTRGAAHAVSVDHVLVGFDGAVLFRGHLPWWGERARTPLGVIAPDVNAETMLLVTEVLAATLSSRRMGFEEAATSLGAVSLGGIARNLFRNALRGVIVPDLDSVWSEHGGDAPNPLAMLSVLAQLDQRGRASPAALGAMVQNLFAERHEAELRTRVQLGLV